MTSTDLHPSLRTLTALALKKDLSLGRMSHDELLVTMAFAAMAIPSESRLTEAQVNALLKTWLSGDGNMLRIDHVELRRTLVDMGFLQRDPFGRIYQRASQHDNAEAAQHLAALAHVDIAELIDSTRKAVLAEREHRKAQFLKNQAKITAVGI